MRRGPKLTAAAAALALLAGAAVLLRVWGLDWGLPRTYNADEPHLVNLAVSFGGGSLKPYAFKYPTLWPTALFLAYGAYFLLWSAFGLRHGVQDFVGLYAWNPTGFYLIGRSLAALASLAAVGVVWRLEREERGEGSLPWAALLLAFAPVAVELAHSAKPDCLMLLFASAAWYSALRLFREGGRRWHWACGAALGLSMSCQYTALPAGLLLPLAHLLSRKQRRPLWLAEGLVVLALAFLAGTPYALLDLPRFRENLRDFAELARLRELDRPEMSRTILLNMWNFAGEGSVAGLAALAGLLRLVSRDWRRAVLMGAPLAAYFLVLSSNTDGGWTRYLLGAFPGLALLASEGLGRWDRPGRPLWTFLLAVLALAPGIGLCAAADRTMTRPDTRAQASAWLRENVPAGSTLILDLPHTGPHVVMAKDQAAELAQRTASAGSPRARLYRAMAETHPGGGYRIYRIQRTPKDLWSNPLQVRLSQADTPTLDVRPGLDPARAVRADYVVLSSYGANPERSPELTSFFEELYREGELVKVFSPAPEEETGPVLRVFRLRRSGV